MARKALVETSDEDMRVDWTFRHGDHVIFTRPRAAVLRSAVLSHIIHHRAQLGVYLRMLDVERADRLMSIRPFFMGIGACQDNIPIRMPGPSERRSAAESPL